MTQVFPLAEAQNWTSSLWLALIAVPLLFLFGYFMLAPRMVKLEVSPAQLAIRGDPIYGRRIPVSQLRLEDAKTVNLNEGSEYRLARRTNGTGLPGYKAGWFQLSGGQKALVFVRDLSRAVMIPHREGWLLLVSPADPEAFLTALRQAKGA